MNKVAVWKILLCTKHATLLFNMMMERQTFCSATLKSRNLNVQLFFFYQRIINAVIVITQSTLEEKKIIHLKP